MTVLATAGALVLAAVLAAVLTVWPPPFLWSLFADEKQFPELANPVQMAWDTKGRLWVSAWRNYPERTPTSKIGDKLLVHTDLDAPRGRRGSRRRHRRGPCRPWEAL